MQIRIANRQDEAPVRALLESRGATLDLPGVDKDLRNLDQSYFGQDGLFVVAEKDGQIIAFAGAKKMAQKSNILELNRMILPAGKEGATADDIKKSFLSIIQNHAYQMDFDLIEVSADMHC